jgi:flavorubredoxin
MAKAIIIYETRTGTTKQIADIIQEGMKEGGVETAMKKIDEVDVAELSGYTAVILGAPTYHKDLMQTMKTFLFKLENAGLKGKVGAAFGAYGWSGEGVEMLSETMKNIYGMDVLEPRSRLLGNPAGRGRIQFMEYGKKIAQKIKEQDK